MQTDFGGSIIVHPGIATPAIEARVTEADTPGYSGSGVQQGAYAFAMQQLGYGSEWGDERVDHDTAMTYSAVWASVRVIAQTIASVCWHSYDTGEQHRVRMPIEDEVSWTLGMQANPEMSALEWRQVMLKDALTWGNGYSEIERTGTGKLAALWRLAPDRVQPIRNKAGMLVYEVSNGPGEEKSYLSPDSVYHLKGLGPDGLVGWSVIRMARKGIKLGLQEERFGTDFFSRGPLPGGTVTIPGNLNDQQRKEYRRSFEEVYSGARNHHRIVVLSNGITFSPANLPNDDAQFLESRKFQITDVARWYGVPPHKIGDLDRSTNNNIEEQGREFVTDCLGPWAARLETEANIKLYGRTNRGRKVTKLDLSPVTQGNSTTQAETASKKVAGGLWTINEGRVALGENPRPEGDVLLVQGAMTTLERVIEGPAPAVATPSAQPPVKADAAPPRASAEDVRRVFGALLADAYGRLYRVDADKAKRAANKGRLAEHVAEWYASDEAVPRVTVALAPVFEAALLALGRDRAEIVGLSRAAAARHVASCVTLLSRDGVRCLEGWESAPLQVAETEMRGIA